MNVLDLFSGIGGFSLGLERAGMRTVAFCEIEPYPRSVLRKHWPTIPCYDDIRTLTADRLKADGIGTIDVICGGFPCQDISVAGKGAGLAGSRSGLWSEYARIIGEIRPRYVIVENVAALLGRGLSTILGNLTEIGYDAEWQIISAADVGAPHLRKRVWIVGYPQYNGQASAEISEGIASGSNSNEARPNETIESTRPSEQFASVAYTASIGQQGQGQPIQRGDETPNGEGQTNIFKSISLGRKWEAEPDVGRVANGIPARVDRLKGLGNAVVPQIPEIIARAILEAEKCRLAEYVK